MKLYRLNCIFVQHMRLADQLYVASMLHIQDYNYIGYTKHSAYLIALLILTTCTTITVK